MGGTARISTSRRHTAGGNMNQIFATILLAAASTLPSIAAETGEPRYFVKAWLEKANRSFEHTTGWCDEKDRCFVPIVEHIIELRDLTSSSYRLKFWSDPWEEEPCCISRTGSSELDLWSGHPRVVPLYYTPKAGDRGVIPFGKLIIAVEDLDARDKAPETPRL